MKWRRYSAILKKYSIIKYSLFYSISRCLFKTESIMHWLLHWVCYSICGGITLELKTWYKVVKEIPHSIPFWRGTLLKLIYFEYISKSILCCPYTYLYLGTLWIIHNILYFHNSMKNILVEKVEKVPGKRIQTLNVSKYCLNCFLFIINFLVKSFAITSVEVVSGSYRFCGIIKLFRLTFQNHQ